MAFQKIIMVGRFSKGISLTFSSCGIVSLSKEAGQYMTGMKYDIYEDEDTMKLKLEANDQGDIELRKLESKNDKRHVFTRSYLRKYLINKYNLPKTFRLTGEVVEDGFVFDIASAQDTTPIKG